MQASEAIDLLMKIISIPSFSGEEDRVADLMEMTWAKLGYRAYRKGNNVWVRSHYFDPAKPTVLLEAHIDTVKPNAAWTFDPFCPEIREGKLFGGKYCLYVGCFFTIGSESSAL